MLPFLIVLHVTCALAAVGWIVWERRSPLSTLSWCYAVTFIPFFGVVAYYVIGPRRMDRKRLRYRGLRQKLRESLQEVQRDAEIPSDVARQVMLALRGGEAPLASATKLDLYRDGASAFAAMEKAIAAARHHVHVEFYIYEPDRLGTRLRDLLAAKAREGVEVRLLVDGMGASRAKKAFFAPILEAGGAVDVFMPPRLSFVHFRLLNFRTHRKIVVVDGRVGFVGSMNVADCHTTGDEKWPKPWRDTHVGIEGSAVHGLQRVFLENWMFVTGSAPTTPAYFPELEDGPHRLQVLHSGPDRLEYNIHEYLFSAIAGADERVLVTGPYLVPDDCMLAALCSAAHRGVDVQLLVPVRSDLRIVDAAQRSYYSELLAAGVKIHEYMPTMLHAKTLLIDRELSFVGTPNLDNRSLRLNFEVAAAIYGTETADQFAAAFAEDLKSARAVTVENVENRSVPERFADNAARLFATLL